MDTDETDNIPTPDEHTIREALQAVGIIEDALEWLSAKIPSAMHEQDHSGYSLYARSAVHKMLADYGFVPKQRAILHKALGESVEDRASVFADLLKDRTK